MGTQGRSHAIPLAMLAIGATLFAGAEVRAASPVSPSGNGRHETNFQPTVSKTEAGIARWEFRIASEVDAKIVHKVVGEGELPKTITWDSKDDSGKPVPDGKYLYIMQVWDGAGNTSFSEEKTVLADSVAPSFTLSAEALPDAVAVATLAGNDAGESGFSKWRVEAQNASGQSVRVFTGEGLPPKELVWDLRDASQNTVPDGKYALVGTGEDGAGNRSETARAEVDLTGKSAPPIPLSFGVKSMAVGADGTTVSNVTFALKATKAAQLKAWSVEIRNEAGIVVRKFEGKGLPPPTLAWDGKSADGQVVAGGIKFHASLKVVPVSTTKEEAKPVSVTVDAQMAQESAEISRAVFHITANAGHAERWVLDVALPNGEVVYHYEHKGDPPTQVTWDGKTNDGDKIEGAVFCRFLLRVYGDGGSVVAVTNPLSVATLTKIARHYVVPGVQFDLGKSELRPAGKERLAEAAEFLQQHPATEVLIEGHTCNLGSRTVNLLLAHKRIQAVHEFLFDEKKCPAGNVRVRALAAAEPVASNQTEEGRSLNRRAEVYLSARVD